MKKILGIESSCDETAAAITIDGRTVAGDIIFSQADLHKVYGGVVPEIASRKHIDVIAYVIRQVLETTGIDKRELDAIAVTNGPGLIGALLVGLSAAKGLAYALKIPLVPVNHIHGHICANYIAYPELEPPFMCLVASGGHSHVIHVRDYAGYEVLGATLDDAAGEAFDKVARVLGLGYPGGPLLSELAKNGDPEAIAFPKPVNGLNFSFSGVKTSVINYVHKLRQAEKDIPKADIAASFQKTAVDILSTALISAAKEKNEKKIAIAGGVASNEALRAALTALAAENGFEFFLPPPALCTDNAAMISCSGYYGLMQGSVASLDLNAAATLPFQ